MDNSIGSGTQAKKDITGSVAVVSRDAITEQPVATFAEALQGRASGVYVSSAGGPAGDTTIRVRGVGSVNGSDPLIIVDGVQGVSVNSVNPNDIDTFQVLKDAAATAIYGAQAANGVIIITTKQGNKEGKVRVSYNGYISASNLANDGYHMLGAYDYMMAEGLSQQNRVTYQGENYETVRHAQYGSAFDANGNYIGMSIERNMPYSIVPQGYSKQQIIDKFGSVDNWINSYNSETGPYYAKSAYYYILEDLHGSEADARIGTDWLDVIKRTGISHNHELSVQGGGDKGQYSMSLGYTKREGPLKGSEFERYNLRLNTTFNPSKHFSLGQNTNAALMQTNGEMGGQGDDNMFARTYTVWNLAPARNVSGTFGGTQGGLGRADTALAGVENVKNDWSRMFRLQSAFFAELKDPWIKGLTLRSQFSVNLNGGWSLGMNERTIEWNKEGSTQNSLSESANWNFGWQFTNTATYKFTVADKHDITLLAGTEALKQGLGRNISASRYDYVFEKDPNTWTIGNGSTVNLSNGGGMGSKTTMFGIFGRADYSYEGRYLATFTIRRDASSKFSENNRWGTFPSVSLGWRISDEPFLAKAHATWLDDLKLRAGYGTTGNSNIGAYNYAFQYGTGDLYHYGIEGGNSAAAVGYVQTALGDTNAKWETVKMFNIGYDLTAFNNRLTSSFDFYIKKTSDMLVPANWTNLAGSGTKPNVNIGDMKNTGIDFSIGWRDKIGQVSYNINANASWYKNEVTKLGSSNLYESTRISQLAITTVGQPISMFYGYVLDGLYKNEQDVLNYALPVGVTDAVQLTGRGNPGDADYVPRTVESWIGHYKFKDVNGDGVVNQDDRTIIGNPHPDLTGGVNIGLNWKNWDLSTYLYFSLGNDMYKMYEYYTYYGALATNFSYERVEKAWHPTENPNGTLPLFTTNNAAPEAGQSHSGYIDDGSYLRMQTLTLGYTLPRKLTQKLTLSRIRLYAQLSNVFTITGYDGLDPEVRTGADRGKGIDYGSYGMPRQYLFGLNIDF
ncbi:MAG: SusC/RagA family TonB-linked outer membrane protein [Bacteroidaceae bacterium]|nr:SusC/RagA family TonB-linked outer membrane protein [Bacteroidaceae bacterium]